MSEIYYVFKQDIVTNLFKIDKIFSYICKNNNIMKKFYDFFSLNQAYEILSFYIKCDLNDKILEIVKIEREEKLFLNKTTLDETEENAIELEEIKRDGLKYDCSTSNLVKSKIYNKKRYGSYNSVLISEEVNFKDLFTLEETIKLFKKSFIESEDTNVLDKLNYMYELIQSYDYTNFKNSEFYKKIIEIFKEYDELDKKTMEKLKEIL